MKGLTRWMTALVAAGGISVAAGGLAAERSPAPRADGTQGSVRLEVDLSERELYVYHGGDLMNTFPVAVGEPEHPTPTGSFSIDRIIWNPGWVPPEAGWASDKEEKDPNDPENPMVGAKLFFSYPDYYIHGTDAPHTVGDAESHGCIRMRPESVLELAEFVQSHGGESRSEGWYDRVSADDATEHEIDLSDPVPIEIRE